jgi:hypothetical protein
LLYPSTEVAGPMVALVLNFEGASILFSMVAAPLVFPSVPPQPY